MRGLGAQERVGTGIVAQPHGVFAQFLAVAGGTTSDDLLFAFYDLPPEENALAQFAGKSKRRAMTGAPRGLQAA